MKNSVYSDQLKDTCKLAGARWAAVLESNDETWMVSFHFGLTKAKHKSLANYLDNTRTKTWLSRLKAEGKTRWRKTRDMQKKFGCDRVYVFSNKGNSNLLIVGSDNLNSEAKKFFNILSIGDFGKGLVDLASLDDRMIDLGKKGNVEFSMDPNEGLHKALISVGAFLPIESAYLAIRSGVLFQIEAVFNHKELIIGKQLSTAKNKTLAKLVDKRLGVVIPPGLQSGKFDPGNFEDESKYSWMVIPLLVGKRVIGVMAFEGLQFSSNDLERASLLAGHVAPAIDKTMTFQDASRHLQNIAAMKELTSVVTVGLNVDEILQRVQRMMETVFNDGKADLLLKSPDGRNLIVANSFGNKKKNIEYPIDSTLVGYVYETGKAIKVGNVENTPHYQAIIEHVQSKLAVPLKFRDDVIGVLSATREKKDAFSKQDENFLMVISSQTTALIENARLNEQTFHKADRLAIINNLVQQVIGLTDQSEIAGRAANLMKDRSGFEMVVVSLLDETTNEFVAKGFAGTQLPDFPVEFRYAKDLGISAKVLECGKSQQIQDTSQEENYFALPGWDPGSEICVPLKEGDHIFGVINVENQKKHAFTENDLLTLEAIAGVLSSVLMYAQRYDELQANIAQLEAVRETALDLSTDLDLNILLKRVVNRVRELVDARGAEVGLIDEDEHVVEVLVSENPWQDYTGYTFPFMSGVAGRVAALGEPFVVADYNDWSGKGKDDFKAPFTTVAGVPLILSGEIIGTLTLQDDRPDRSFGPEDVQILEMIAPQITVFIRNARLYQELGERMEAQRLAESRLIRSARLAAVGEMAAGVAHELNNPLTTVTGFTELILEELPEDFPHKQDLEMVLSESRRAIGVVRRLLDFSRQGDILRTLVNVNDVMGDVLALVHHLAKTSGIEISIELSEGLPEINVDRNQMQQVFLNIIHNGIQAMPDGGDLLVRSSMQQRDDRDWISIVVQDTGEGIAQEELPRIFEPFYTTKPSGTGTGLGLSISYGIVADHGGMMDVESDPGKGTCFTILLPVIPESEGISA